jgi:hypothetical protein
MGVPPKLAFCCGLAAGQGNADQSGDKLTAWRAGCQWGAGRRLDHRRLKLATVKIKSGQKGSKHASTN